MSEEDKRRYDLEMAAYLSGHPIDSVKVKMQAESEKQARSCYQRFLKLNHEAGFTQDILFLGITNQTCRHHALRMLGVRYFSWFFN